MAKQTPKPPALQVLFEPWPDTDEGAWDREGSEAFAGWYWLDALDADGNLKPYGYRAYLSGCTVCRRADNNPRAHWLTSNDTPSAMGGKPRVRHCGTWKTIEKIVKTFGGWKRVHYVELPESEGLRWQSLQGRVRGCRTCGGEGFVRAHKFALREDCNGCSGSGNEIAIGPKLPDRHGMTAAQLRKR